MRWQNPRFRCFEDGSSGVRIEEDDLQNILIEVSWAELSCNEVESQEVDGLIRSNEKVELIIQSVIFNL